MLHSVKSRLTLWSILALAVTSTASVVVGYAFFVLANSEPAVRGFGYILLIAMYLLLLAAPILLFRRMTAHCLDPLLDLSKKCREIRIDNLDLRFTPPDNCTEGQQLVAQYNDMLERLEEGAKRIRQFSGDASHELRTPLTILRGETEVGLRWAKTSAEFRDILQSNMEEIDRMGRIIEDLLTLTKNESGALPLSIGDLSLSDLLQELYLKGRALAEPKQIEVNLHHEANSEIWIRGDDLRLRQIFLNLLSNAIRYTGEHGSIDIAVSRKNQKVAVAISDNGIGIAKEHLPHIFERFFRTDEARNRSDGGTGLGLAIVKWAIEAHDGDISVTSTPGIGSTFTIRLPVDGPKIPNTNPDSNAA
ncbi:MAG: ATP-binding protein [Thermodesulfobacteriota bacterium]|nr:ATP-binding protein [Thermodesulfobacteriota bacterium]